MDILKQCMTRKNFRVKTHDIKKRVTDHMQLKKSVMNIVLPVMERNGFKLIDSATGYYEFGINDDSLRVVVDRNPWPPSELRALFCYRDYHGSFAHIGLDRLYGYQDLDLFYDNQEKLEAKLKTIANILETFALSFLASMRDNYVFWEKETHLLFSENPKKQAANYAKKYFLTMSFELSNFLFLENQITAMRGDTIYDWRQNFEKYTDEIIGLASYYGEIIRRKDRAKWEAGILVYDQGSSGPSYEVIAYWNYGLYMPASRLVPLDLR